MTAPRPNTLALVRDPLSGKGFTALPGRRAYLYTEDGSQSFTFEFAPRAIDYGPWEDDWTQVERVGLAPLLMRKGGKLEEITFTINLADRTDYFADQGGHLAALQRVARSRVRVMFRYSEWEAGLWRVTACGMTSEHRHPATSRITRATADITLTRASDPAPGVGPVSRPANPAPARPATAQGPTRFHVVKRGDTLWGLAHRYYDNAFRWPVIYDANRSAIGASPHRIKPGARLRIP